MQPRRRTIPRNQTRESLDFGPKPDDFGYGMSEKSRKTGRNHGRENLPGLLEFPDNLDMLLRRVVKPSVIARRVPRAVAIQLDCFVVPQDGTPRNDSLKTRPGPFSPMLMNALTRNMILAAALGAAMNLGAPAWAAEVGQPAPDFALSDLDGTAHKLSDYKGKLVVLEWVNPECPIVQKHYNKSGNIPRLQKAYTGQGVVWLSINSAAAGKQGDYEPGPVKAWMQQVGAAPTDYFRDQTGAVGHLFGAKTTPHIFIINRDGTLVYAGGIDSIPSADPADIPQAKNYVDAAMADLAAGRPVAMANTRPYGCSVKY
jgi:hypothetical protein